MRLLLLCVLLVFALFASSQVIKVGTIVNQENAFFSSKDVPILQGVQLWAKWTNQNGGVMIGGVPHNISVITRYVPGGNDTEENIRNISRLLAEEDQVDLMIPMFSTQRTAWAYPEANAVNPNILQCGVGTSLDTSLFAGGSNWYAVSKGGILAIPPLVNLVLELSNRKTFSILYPTESPFYVTLAAAANSSVSSHPEAEVLFYEDYESDRENVDVVLLSQALIALRDADSDIFWYVNNFADDIVTMTLVMQAQGYTPEAAVMGTSMESYSQDFFTKSNLWISQTSYHPDFELGVSGIHLGTMHDYSNYHQELYSLPPQIAWSVSASACGVMLQLAIEVTDAAGKNWRNATEVQEEMHKLQGNESIAQTFFGPIGKLDSKNRNPLRPTTYVQFINGEMKLLKTSDDIVYPAPWPWAIEEASSTDIGITVGIILGSIAGAFFLLLAVCAIVALVLYIVKKKFYHLIILPKGHPDLSPDQL